VPTRVRPRLSDLGDNLSKQIINWGYAVTDRSIRKNYTGPLNASAAQLPFPEAKITQP
jgi:NTE family protein